MKVAVIGSRDMDLDLIENIGLYLPENTTMIISGGARGVDRLAEKYADKVGLPKQIFHPNYLKYGRGAPLRRNRQIVEAADYVVAFWDGVSTGTQYTLAYAQKLRKSVRVFLPMKE